MKVCIVLLVAAAAGFAQHHQSPAQDTAQARHHAFLEEERAAIERGEGFGMAMAADRNGFPGPRHVLDLAAELKLTAEQRRQVEKLFGDMKQKAMALGREVLDAEKRLEEMFAAERSETELREQTRRIAALRAGLRWVHLEAHLAARRLLTADQVSAYHRLRHPGSAPPRHH